LAADLRGLIRTTFAHRCPACGHGPLFRRGLTLHAACSACGLDLEGRHGAHYGGPIIMGYSVGGLTSLLVFALLFWRFGYAPWVLWVTLLAATTSVVLAFRHCKAFWTWWLYVTGELGGDGTERREQTGQPEQA
jgi:uncharacterized protein (DUF983 family)